MATLTAHRPHTQRSLLDLDRGDEVRLRPVEPRAQRRTLDDLVTGTWQSLAVAHAAACPVCSAELTPRWSSGPNPVAAACRSCGSQLS